MQRIQSADILRSEIESTLRDEAEVMSVLCDILGLIRVSRRTAYLERVASTMEGWIKSPPCEILRELECVRKEIQGQKAEEDA